MVTGDVTADIHDEFAHETSHDGTQTAEANHAPAGSNADAHTMPADSARYIGIGLGVGIAGAVLTYGRIPALGFALFVVLLVGALFLNARLQNVVPSRKNMLVVLPILLFFTVMLVVRSDESLVMANLSMSTLAALLLIYFFSGGNVLQQDLIDYAFKSVITSVAVWFQPFEELFRARKWLSSRPKGSISGIEPVLRGLVITIPVVLVFVVLFSSADEEFAKLVRNILNVFTLPKVDDFGGYTLTAMMLTWLAIGGFGFALSDRKIKRDKASVSFQFSKEDTAKQVALPIHLGFTETTMLLGSVCSVFAAFVAIQFRYLFGGAGNIDVSKFNFSEYLHRGFAELVTVGVLTLALAYILNVVAIRKTERQTNTFRVLLTVLVVLTGVILASAFQRLRLYEEAYGFTALRLLIYVFIIWLGILFAGFTLSLYWQPHAVNVFGTACLIALFGFFATLNILNPDAFVAQEMVARNDVDPIYLISLSDEAVPVMASLVNSPQQGLSEIMRASLIARRDRLTNSVYSDWRSFTFAHNSALAAINSVNDQIKYLNGTLASGRYTSPHFAADDFKGLKKGMTFREIIRTYGYPYDYNTDVNSASYRGIATDSRTRLLVEYQLKDGRFMVMYVDTANGLDYACVGDNTSTCDVYLK